MFVLKHSGVQKYLYTKLPIIFDNPIKAGFSNKKYYVPIKTRTILIERWLTGFKDYLYQITYQYCRNIEG